MADVHAIAAEINALSPAAQLRLAADLLERRTNLGIAHTIIERVATELGAALALQELDQRARNGGAP